MEAEYVSWDIETKYNHTSCIGFSDDIKFALCVPLIARGTHYWSTPEEERAIWEFFRDVLSAKSKKIGQNLLFDCSHMRAHGIRVANIYHDCMLAQNVLYPELEKSLGVLVSIYTNEQYHKGEGKKALKKLGSDKAWAGSTVDDDLFLYNCKDAAYTLEVSFAQMEEFKKLHSFQRKIV